MLRRTIHPEVRVLDASAGLVEYVASDETVDSYREVIRATGWRFDDFEKNAPFVDSHEYGTIEKLVGKVVDFAVRGKQLVETVQWAIDVPENKLAQLGWKMTQAGYLRAVSVGFVPLRVATPHSSNSMEWQEALQSVGGKADSGIRAIYLEQQQKELSACILGANPNALAKSYKAGALTDSDLEFLTQEATPRLPANPANDPAVAELALQQEREAHLLSILLRIGAF